MSSDFQRIDERDQSLRFSRERRDFLVANRIALRCDSGWVNHRSIPYFLPRQMCPDGDLCKDCEYALHMLICAPKEVHAEDGLTEQNRGCLGWVDQMVTTKRCCFCFFLAGLFLDRSPGFTQSDLVCESNRRRFCLWLPALRVEDITPTQPHADQLSWLFRVAVQEVSDYDLDTERTYSGSKYIDFRLHLSSVELAIKLFGRHSTEAAMLNLARVVAPLWNSALFRDALRTCRERHGTRCEALAGVLGQSFEIRSTTSSQRIANLRMVDVRDWCVVDFSGTTNYIALSYCWPQGQQVTLNRSNEIYISRAGSLRSLQLSHVIQDAIQAVYDLGERYLWIDSLCIVQDAEEDKKIQMNQMDTIYREATMTIVVASSSEDNLDCGIPGVSDLNPRTPSREVNVRGLRLVESPETLWNALLNTRWSSRAWTFQEYLLSKRLLIFMPKQAYFLCEQADFAEGFIDHMCMTHGVIEEKSLMPCCDRTWTEADNDGKAQDRPQNYHNTYADLVESYSQKQMSFDSDVLNATRGLLTLLAHKHNVSFLCGLPVPHLLSYFATWCPNGSLTRRKSDNVGMAPPSWSWAGWKGRVTYLDTNLLGVREQGPDFDETGVHVELESEVEDWNFELMNPVRTFHRSELDALEMGELLCIQSGMLLFTTQVVDRLMAPGFCQGPHAVSPEDYGDIASSAVGIPQFRSSELGSLCFPLIVQKQRAGILIMHSTSDTDNIADVCLPGYQLIALSRSNFYWNMEYPISLDDPDDEINFRYDNADGDSIERPPFDESYWKLGESIVNVLLVRSEADTVYRVGVGQIHWDAWQILGPVERHIRLG